MRRFLAPTPASASHARRAAAALSGLAVATLASGCMVFNPVQTDVPYEPADGVSANVGQLALRDLVVVGGGGGSAVVSGSAINLSNESMTVQVAPQSSGGASASGSEVRLRPRQQLSLATKGLRLEGIEAKPGTVIPISITSTPGGTTIVQVPVLAATGAYETITPAPTTTP